MFDSKIQNLIEKNLESSCYNLFRTINYFTTAIMPLRSANKSLSLKNFREDDTLIEICLRVVDHVDAMLAYWDKDEICRFANNAYMEWFGKSRDEMIGKMTFKKLLGVHYPEILPYIKKVLTGKKQVFERELNLPDGSLRHYITTYIPDKTNGKISGFFVHVADINLIKELETKLLDSEKAKRREVLRSVIETHETERELISYELREKVNQTLAYSKMMLKKVDKNKDSKTLLTMISHNIHEAIDELNRISTNLTPSVIIMIGFIAGVKEYINDFKKRYSLIIRFNCLDEKIENLSINDKISIFRIIQNYILIVSDYPACKIANIEIRRLDSKLILRMQNNYSGFELPLQSKEFIDIQHRLEYYDGAWKHISKKNKKTLLVEFNIPS